MTSVYIIRLKGTEKLFYHSDLEDIGLCNDQINILRELVPHEPFTAREAVDAYIANGQNWTDIVHAYQALVTPGGCRMSD